MSVAFSSDDRQSITASKDGAILISDVESGKQLRDLKSPVKSLTAQGISANRKRLVMAGDPAFLTTLIDIASGKTLLTVRGHMGSAWAEAFSQDGKQIFIDTRPARRNSIISFFAGLGLKRISPLCREPLAHRSLAAFSRDGKSLPRRQYPFDAVAAKPLQQLSLGDAQEGPASFIVNLSFALDSNGKRMIVCSSKASALIDVATNKQLIKFAPATTAAFSTDSRYLALGGKEQLTVHDLTSGNRIRTNGCSRVEGLRGKVAFTAVAF